MKKAIGARPRSQIASLPSTSKPSRFSLPTTIRTPFPAHEYSLEEGERSPRFFLTSTIRSRKKEKGMASPRAILLAMAITALALIHGVSTKGGADLDLEEDLSFLEEDEDDVGGYSFLGSDDAFPEYTGDEADDEEELDHEGFAESDHDAPPAIDETDVAVLTDTNFSDFVGKRPHVMVEFYAQWCSPCQALSPEYAAAATALRGEDVALAKVDATEENELAQKYEIPSFLTVLFFVDGVHKDYPGQRTKKACGENEKGIPSTATNLSSSWEKEVVSRPFSLSLRLNEGEAQRNGDPSSRVAEADESGTIRGRCCLSQMTRT